MTAPPLVAVIIPTHKRLGMLRDALGSALSQTMGDLEVIVAVDGDDPETAAFVRSVADGRVRLQYDGVQRGEALNTINGMGSSEAPYFGILHDDDQWEPDLLESLLPPLQADEDLSVCFGDHHVMGEDGIIDVADSEESARVYGRNVLSPGRHQPFFREALIDKTLPAVMTSVFRRSAIDLTDVPVGLPANFDVWLAWTAVRGDRAVYYVDKQLSRYRIHGGSGTARARRAWLESAVMLFGAFTDEPELRSVRPELRSRLSDAYRRLARLQRESGERGSIRTGLLSVRAHISVKSVGGLVLLLASGNGARAAR